MENPEHIELRSKKVRNIVGKIPPRIIRFGISILFFLVIGLLIGSHFFKYAYTVKTTAVVESHNNAITIRLKIPASQIKRVKAGQRIILYFDKLSNLYGERSETYLQSVPTQLVIDKNGGWYIALIKTNKLYTAKKKKISVISDINIRAEIITGKVSFLDRILQPVKEIVSKRSKNTGDRY